ncbi:MAG: 3-isopropylmalate dehydratase small subunit [Burkholderiales bacterium]
MKPFGPVRSVVIPMLQADINTDEIIPGRFMSRPRIDFGQYLFHDRRFDVEGRPLTGFVLNETRYRGAQMLLGGENFGCGSSREHAVFALADYGIRVLMAPSFADIFHANCLTNAVLPIVLTDKFAQTLRSVVNAEPDTLVDVDLATQTLRLAGHAPFEFQIDPFRKHNILSGLDDLDRTTTHVADIERFEARRSATPI